MPALPVALACLGLCIALWIPLHLAVTRSR